MKRLLLLFAVLPLLAGAQVPIKPGHGRRGHLYLLRRRAVHVLGKLQALERVAGTSAGSIVAACCR